MAEQINNEEMNIAIEIQTELNPEGIKNLKDMFGIYIQKMVLLTSQFSKNEVDKDKVVNQVTQFLMTIEKRMIGNWCMVETFQAIIKTLEEHIKTTDANLDDIRSTVFKK